MAAMGRRRRRRRRRRPIAAIEMHENTNVYHENHQKSSLRTNWPHQSGAILREKSGSATPEAWFTQNGWVCWKTNFSFATNPMSHQNRYSSLGAFCPGGRFALSAEATLMARGQIPRGPNPCKITATEQMRNCHIYIYIHTCILELRPTLAGPHIQFVFVVVFNIINATSPISSRRGTCQNVPNATCSTPLGASSGLTASSPLWWTPQLAALRCNGHGIAQATTRTRTYT